MNKRKAVLLSLVILFFGFLASCTETGDNPVADNEAPTITGTFSHASDARISGDSLYFSTRIEDNVSLKFYSVKVAYVGTKKTNASEWERSEFFNVSGKSVGNHFDWIIPQDAASGAYQISINAEDEAGNKAKPWTYDFTITNSGDSIAPTISVISPNVTTADTFSLTTTMMIKANLTDNIGLGSAWVEIATTSGTVKHTISYPTLNATQFFSIDTSYTIPGNFGTGEFLANFYSKDINNNQNIESVTFYTK